jgi:hypothetical protein
MYVFYHNRIIHMNKQISFSFYTEANKSIISNRQLGVDSKIEKKQEEQCAQLSIRYARHHLIDIQRYKRGTCPVSFKRIFD